MSTTCEVPFEPLALDGSNYASWSAHVLNVFRTISPLAEQVVVVSILPPHLNVDKVDLSTLSQKELECWQLNAQITKYLYSVLSDDVQDIIYEECEIDAHLI